MSDVLVLCYHAVSARWQSEFAIDPDILERQLRSLLDRGYKPTTFTDSVLSPPAPRTLAVTFDDAFLSVFEDGLPVLSELGMPGTIFVCSDFVGRNRPMPLAGMERWMGTPHEDDLRCTSWRQLAQLLDRGWEVGSHTASHPRLTQLDDARLADELQRSRAECERQLGISCRSLAYPHGDVDGRVARAAGSAGYLAAGTLLRDTRSPGPLLFPRLPLYRHDGVLRARVKAIPAIRRLNRSRAWTALRPAYALLTPERAHDDP